MDIRSGVKSIGSRVKDFGKGLKVIFGSAEGGGDRRLAKVSLLVEEMLNNRDGTKHEIRRRVIKNIEKTLASEMKKGGSEAVDRKVAISLATPEYVRMLRKINLDEPHIKVLVMEAKKKYAK